MLYTRTLLCQCPVGVTPAVVFLFLSAADKLLMIVTVVTMRVRFVAAVAVVVDYTRMENPLLLFAICL